jgi:WD40 repeat protein
VGHQPRNYHLGSGFENSLRRGHGQACTRSIVERTGSSFNPFDVFGVNIFPAQNGTLLIGTSTCEIVTVDITAPDTAPTVLRHLTQSHLMDHLPAVSTRSGTSALAQWRSDRALCQSTGELRCNGDSSRHSRFRVKRNLILHQVGEDRTLRFWDLEQRRMEAAFNLGMRCRSVHVSPDGRLYAVGHAAGQFSLWDVATMRCAAKNSFRKEEVDDIRFR